MERLQVYRKLKAERLLLASRTMSKTIATHLVVSVYLRYTRRRSERADKGENRAEKLDSREIWVGTITAHLCRGN